MDYRIIIESCKRGKREGQSQLYDLFSARLYTICLRYSSNREEARDLLQETFIKIFQNIGKFNYDGSFEGWCRRIAVNTSLSYIRSKAFLQSVRAEDVMESHNLEDKALSDNIELAELLNMLSKLPLQKKIIFSLYEIEGYSHSEIAEMLHITEGTSRGQLAKAKEALRDIHHKMNLQGTLNLNTSRR